MKRIISPSAVTIMLLTIALLITIGYAQYNWPMFHMNPTHNGYTASPGPSKNQTLWVYDTKHDIFGPCPAIVDNVLYISGGYGTSVFAINATTGVQIWNYTRLTWISSSPAVANGLVYFGGFDKNVTALNATTGNVVWNYTGLSWFAASSPAVVDGTLYIGGGYANNVLALNALTGEYLWNFTAGHQVHSSPAVAYGMVYIGSYDNNMYALNATTGAKIWEHATGNDIFSSPAVADGMVYIGSYDNNMYALNATTGANIWNYTTGNWVASSPAISNGIVYVGSYDNNVYAFNAATGAKIWSYETGGAISSSPAIASNGMVYIGSGDNNTYALNAQTGAKIWSYKTGGDVFPGPAVADGVVYAASRDGKIYAFMGSLQTYDVPWESQVYQVTILSNSSLLDFQFSQPDKTVSFSIVGPKGMPSFCNVTIPKSLLDDQWTVKVDTQDTSPIITHDDSNTYIYVSYTHTSTSAITITGTTGVPEYSTATIMALLLVVMLLATLIGKNMHSTKTWQTDKAI
jgi:outer membrane protein assembly factor BamB